MRTTATATLLLTLCVHCSEGSVFSERDADEPGDSGRDSDEPSDSGREVAEPEDSGRDVDERSYVDRLVELQRFDVEYGCPCDVADGLYGGQDACEDNAETRVRRLRECLAGIHQSATVEDQTVFGCAASLQEEVNDCLRAGACSDGSLRDRCEALFNDEARPCGAFSADAQTRIQACLSDVDVQFSGDDYAELRVYPEHVGVFTEVGTQQFVAFGLNEETRGWDNLTTQVVWQSSSERHVIFDDRGRATVRETSGIVRVRCTYPKEPRSVDISPVYLLSEDE